MAVTSRRRPVHGRLGSAGVSSLFFSFFFFFFFFFSFSERAALELSYANRIDGGGKTGRLLLPPPPFFFFLFPFFKKLNAKCGKSSSARRRGPSTSLPLLPPPLPSTFFSFSLPLPRGKGLRKRSRHRHFDPMNSSSFPLFLLFFFSLFLSFVYSSRRSDSRTKGVQYLLRRVASLLILFFFKGNYVPRIQLWRDPFVAISYPFFSFFFFLFFFPPSFSGRKEQKKANRLSRRPRLSFCFYFPPYREKSFPIRLSRGNRYLPPPPPLFFLPFFLFPLGKRLRNTLQEWASCTGEIILPSSPSPSFFFLPFPRQSPRSRTNSSSSPAAAVTPPRPPPAFLPFFSFLFLLSAGNHSQGIHHGRQAVHLSSPFFLSFFLATTTSSKTTRLQARRHLLFGPFPPFFPFQVEKINPERVPGFSFFLSPFFPLFSPLFFLAEMFGYENAPSDPVPKKREFPPPSIFFFFSFPLNENQMYRIP